jgi:hypothetical protein
MSEKDFDFIFGDWTIHNRKLSRTTDPDCTEWVEFAARGQAEPILGGFGHVDRMFSDAPPGDEPFEGFTLRLYDPSADLWRIWWSSSRVPGLLDPPVEGRWVDGRGTFECDDVLDGRPARVRFEWTRESETTARWQQSFSYDGGENFRVNWVMDFTRA